MAITNLSFRDKIYKLSYEICGNLSGKTILIMHGWGANKELMKMAFEKPLSEFKQVYIDLPGFGKSSIEEELVSSDYALLVSEFIRAKNLQIDYLMGHSYGGKIASILAANFADKELNLGSNLSKNTRLILLSSAGILIKKPLKVRVKIKLFKLLKIFGFARLYKLFASKDAQSLSPLMYEVFKKIVNEDFSEIFAKIKLEALIFWGIDDKATPLYAGEKISSLISNSQFFTLGGDHFFFLKQNEKIAELIKNAKFINKTSQKDINA